MTARVWDQFLTESDKAHLATTKPNQPYGFGQRAAVLSVDNYRAAIGDRPEPLLDAVKTWPSSCGLAGWTALQHITTLLAAARAAGLPVIHATGLAMEESGIAGWSTRRGPRGVSSDDAASTDRHTRRYDLVEQAAPLPGEVVLKKTAPSAFFGTPLAAHLISEGIDTVIVCGEAVSGCVRATVVDGRSYRLRMIVVEECVYDRHEATRAINLFDMDQKYADVVSLTETLSWIDSRARAAPPAEPGPDNHHHPGHAHPPADALATLHWPDAILAALPPGAVPVSFSHHPIHGHVVSRAGREVIDAAREDMSAQFGDNPHVVVTVGADEARGRPDLQELLGRTEGGVLLLGVGYQHPHGSTLRTSTDNSCPECGGDRARIESSADSSEMRPLYVCEDCGAAWDA